MPELYSSDNQTQLKPTGSPLSAFCFLPTHAKFENQDPDEKVILLLRRHPVTNLPWIALGLLLALVPSIAGMLDVLSILPARFQFATVILWYLLTLAIVIQGALTWFFNVNIVTNRRIIDVNFYTLIYREISDAKINNIQEITYKVGGFLGTFLHFGDVVIQTAGALPNFNFEKVPNPARVTDILHDLQKNGGNL
ncbi:MAG: PH domain-containing protein [Patescibacteria group bacterium]